MTRIQKNIIIKASVEEVFNYASDWQKWKDWFVGISKVRTTNEKKQATELVMLMKQE